MTTRPSRHRIALIDWNWKGHHPAYFCLFTRTLLELDCEVHALCPDPEWLRESLSDLPLATREYLSCDLLPSWTQAPRRTPERLKPLISSIRNFYRLRRELLSAGTNPDLLFFACIYDWEFYYFPIVQWLLPAPWAGLYLQSFGFRKTTSPIYAWNRRWSHPERFTRSPQLRAIGTLDEGIKDQLEALAGKGKHILFPDITDRTPPEQGNNTLASKIKRFADGKPIIVFCGMLYPQRGVDLFLQTALANPQWCFAIVGEIPDLNPEQATHQLLDRFLRMHPYGYFHPIRIPSESIYNSVIAISDVVWNVHIDWPGSSNTLTKAALFEKPVVASDKHLLAERVRKFRLGELCNENSPNTATEALARLLNPTIQWNEVSQPRWSEYLSRHSQERLREAFSQVLAASTTTP